MDYNFRIKHPYRRHHYVLQNVLILQDMQMTLYTMGNSSSFVADPAATVDRDMTNAHHLLSLPVLRQSPSCRGIRLLLNSGLMALL